MITEELNQQEFQKLAFQTSLAKSIIANQYATNHNEILKHTDYYKANIKKYGRPYTLALIKAEKKEFDKVDNVDSKRVDELFSALDRLTETLSRCVFVDYDEANDALKALAKNSDEDVLSNNKILNKWKTTTKTSTNE